MTDNNRMFAKLLALAVRFKSEMKNQIIRARAPHEIKDHIYIGQPQAGALGDFIEITIPLSEAPAAAAFEWGSGERAEGGGKEYPIIARDALLFPKADWPQYEPPPPAPRIFKFYSVMHPGVESRPYIRPSIQAVMEDARRLLGEAIKAEISITEGKGTEEVIIGKQ